MNIQKLFLILDPHISFVLALPHFTTRFEEIKRVIQVLKEIVERQIVSKIPYGKIRGNLIKFLFFKVINLK